MLSLNIVLHLTRHIMEDSSMEGESRTLTEDEIRIQWERIQAWREHHCLPPALEIGLPDTRYHYDIRLRAVEQAEAVRRDLDAYDALRLGRAALREHEKPTAPTVAE